MDTLTQSGALQLADNIRASEIAKNAATSSTSRCECHSCTQARWKMSLQGQMEEAARRPQLQGIDRYAKGIVPESGQTP